MVRRNNLELVIAMLIGIIIGFSIFLFVRKKYIVGDLRVDHSDLEDEPYLFLELKSDVDSLINKKYVIMKVQIKDFIPHK